MVALHGPRPATNGCSGSIPELRLKSNNPSSKRVNQMNKPIVNKEENLPVTRVRKRPVKAVAKPTEQDDNLHKPLSSGPNYTLESQNLIVEMVRLHDNAIAEINSIEAEQASIHERAQRDMQTIADRAKAEIDARGMRIADLRRSIALVTGGLSNDPGGAGNIPPAAPSLQESDSEQ